MAKERGKPFVLYINNYSRLFDPSGLSVAGTLCYSSEYLKQILQNMTICTPTQHLQRILLAHHDIDAHVLPPIAENVFWTLKATQWTGRNPLELAFVGSDSFAKNSAILPQVLAGLKDRGIVAYIHIYCPPGAAQPARSEIVSYRPSYGWGQRNTFADDLALNHILIHPMRSYEAFGRAVLEATQLGLPVVSTRCGGPEEILGKHGYFFDLDFEPEAICDCLLVAAEESAALDLREHRIEASHRFEETKLRGTYARFINSL